MSKEIAEGMSGKIKILICTDFYVNNEQCDFLNHKRVFNFYFMH